MTPQPAECSWKPNWPATKQHFTDWWNREGLVIGMWGAPPTARPRHGLPKPEPAASIADSYTNIGWRTRASHHDLSGRAFPADTLPLANTNMGPGVLATFLGSEPDFTPNTVWYAPAFSETDDPESLPPLHFDSGNRWWLFIESLLRESRELAGNDYLVGCPDLIENMDILASLRDTQTLLVDLLERPDWVTAKLKEINQAWFDAYSRIYDIIKLPDDSSACHSFYLWGPGKTMKVQCDLSAMISPAMFEKIVVPTLAEQVEWLDHSMYHLDGTQAICHLDHLLGIQALDAIEWTPQAGIEPGDSPRWWDMYRRILDAGKSVQVLASTPDKVVPLLDAIGGKGVYIMTGFETERQAEDLLTKVEQFR